MIDFSYLSRGLSAMARAHLVNTMAGHLGAAVVAGHFVGEQHPELDPGVCSGIEGELDRIVAGESVFSPKDGAALTACQMFDPFPGQPADAGLVDGIAQALSRNIGRARQSGHNVIFASIAIRAFRDHPSLATPAVVEGIRQLIAGFDNASPGSGYYGKEKGRIDGRKIELSDDDGIGPIQDLDEMATLVINDLLQHASQYRNGYGGPWHVINHAAGLVELSRYGHADLAQAGLPAFREHFRLFRSVPDVTDEFGPETPTVHSPLVPAFWHPGEIRRGRAHLTHRIKTLYGFYVLEGLIRDDTLRQQAREKLLCLM